MEKTITWSKRQLMIVFNFLLRYPVVPAKLHDWLLVLYGYPCNPGSTIRVAEVVPLFILAAVSLLVHCTMNPRFL